LIPEQTSFQILPPDTGISCKGRKRLDYKFAFAQLASAPAVLYFRLKARERVCRENLEPFAAARAEP
jgi:hypothetical protein